MRLVYHPEAEAEFLDTVRFYEQRVDGLGAAFIEAFDEAVAQIVRAPERWPLVH